MRVGPYEVSEELGRGGAGVVYRARSPDGRDVAVKVLKDRAGDHVARFERERRLLASLAEKEGFVPLLDAGNSHLGPFLVMPFVPGGTLRERLLRGPLAVSEVVAIGRRLAGALGAAHALGIVHRDLKPENVLFTHRGAESGAGVPLIADLGLAKLAPGTAGTGASLSRTGEGRGTALYMAPEQLGDSKHVGPAADVFSLGVVLYEALSGSAPFDAATTLEVMSRIARGTFAPLRSVRPDVPAWLEAVVHHALEHDPERRLRDGLALERALLAGPSVRGRGLRVAVALALLATVAGGVAAVSLRSSTPVSTSPSTPPIKPASKPAPSPPVKPPPPPVPTKFVPTAEHRAELDRALAVAKEGQQQEARAVLDALLDSAPRFAEAWNIRCALRYQMGDGPGSLADATRAIELDPSLAKAWKNRAAPRIDAGDYEGGIADCDRAIELDPSVATAWKNRGRARFSLGRTAEAIADFTQAIELDPRLVSALLMRAECRQTTRQLDLALADVDRAVDIAPRDAHLRLVRARIRIALGHPEGALEDANLAVVAAPDDPEALCTRASVWGALGEIDRMLADATHALERKPDHAAAWALRGEARVHLGDREGAIADLERALDLGPPSSVAGPARVQLEKLRATPK